MSDLVVSNVQFTPATRHNAETGLLGYLSLALNEVLMLDGITLRQSTDGTKYIAYPSNASISQYGMRGANPLNASHPALRRGAPGQ